MDKKLKELERKIKIFKQLLNKDKGLGWYFSDIEKTKIPFSSSDAQLGFKMKFRFDFITFVSLTKIIEMIEKAGLDKDCIISKEGSGFFIFFVPSDFFIFFVP